ncbi:MAG TPA: MBL fold metallo-hydrolase [Dehalococcoidia bacterium]|nr:MBL fold metallo-hydrolase [Dehalococcoidia bacterium]
MTRGFHCIITICCRGRRVAWFRIQHVVKFTVTVLYDNETVRSGLKADWGFAALVCAASGENVLFDTGADGTILLHNAECLGVDHSVVQTVVISHWHWDHAGGLPFVIKQTPQAHLYAPSGASGHVPEKQFHVVGSGQMEIVPGIYSTGVLAGIEQALVLQSDAGGLVIMGCAHPGVHSLLEAASSIAEPSALVGGLHGFRDLPLLDTLDVVYPCHCTQRKREILQRYPLKAKRCGVGMVLTA